MPRSSYSETSGLRTFDLCPWPANSPLACPPVDLVRHAHLGAGDDAEAIGMGGLDRELRRAPSPRDPTRWGGSSGEPVRQAGPKLPRRRLSRRYNLLLVMSPEPRLAPLQDRERKCSQDRLQRLSGWLCSRALSTASSRQVATSQNQPFSQILR